MAPQGVSDVIVPLEALPKEVLDGFNQLFLDVWQPPLHLTITSVPPPAMLAYDCVPLSKMFQLMPLRQFWY